MMCLYFNGLNFFDYFIYSPFLLPLAGITWKVLVLAFNNCLMKQGIRELFSTTPPQPILLLSEK